MTKAQILEGLQAGRKLRCDWRDDPLLSWLLKHSQVSNSGIVQVSDQYSYIEFSWRESAEEKR